MPRKPSNQIRSSTPMPSVPTDLGKYVTVRPALCRPPKRDGTRRVFFQVPERLRPSDWPSLIPLPVTGARKGDLTDADEVSRIQTDAVALYERLVGARAGETVIRQRRDLPALNRAWQGSQRFKGTKPRTQKGYAYHAGLIEDWSGLLGHPLVATVGSARIETFLASYDDRPTTRRHLKIVLKMMLDHAMDLGWIEKNHAARIASAAPKSKVSIWEPADVEHYAAAALAHGQPAIAALIRTQWEIGQRLTDARLFRHGAEYEAGVFRFWQEKTGSYVTIPVSKALRDLLAEIRVKGSLYLFVDTATGRPFEEQRLGHEFIAIKADGGRALTLRALRHSCVVQLARAGCTVPEIASITGHSILSVERILSLYLPRDNEVAWNAQKKRGLVTGKRPGNERV